MGVRGTRLSLGSIAIGENALYLTTTTGRMVTPPAFFTTQAIGNTVRGNARQNSLLPSFIPSRTISTSQRLYQQSANKSANNSGTDTATSKAERTRRRFWKKVDIAYSEGKPANHLLIRLDGRSLKTPSGAVLAIPTDRSLLATLIAKEWSEQESILHTHSLPLTSLAARAIDGLDSPSQRKGVVEALVEYLHTETICFHEDHPANLVKLQKERWDPILAWVKERFNTPKIRVFDDIFDVKQDVQVVEILRDYVIQSYNGWDLAALERIVRSTKSFLIGLRLIEAVRQGGQAEADFGVHDAALAAEVEVQSQTERWGEVEDTHDVDFADLRKILGSATAGVVRDSNEVAKEIANVVVSSPSKK